MVSENAERKSRRFWILVILGFFALDLSIAAIAITMAAGDPSFRSIPGYGERAVSWNERQELQEAWRQMEYTVAFERISAPKSQAGSGESGPTCFLNARLEDSDSKPVSGMLGTVRLFHYTRVAKQYVAELHEQSPGVYVAEIDVAKDGLWSIEIEWKTSDGARLWFQQEVNWTSKAREQT